jgi:hypothetical protein
MGWNMEWKVAWGTRQDPQASMCKNREVSRQLLSQVNGSHDVYSHAKLSQVGGNCQLLSMYGHGDVSVT